MMFRRSPKQLTASCRYAAVERGAIATVESNADGLRVTRVEVGDGALTAAAAGDRRALVAPVTGVLHRLDLPPADGPTTRKLIAAQLESIVPGQGDHLSWAWQRTGDDGPTLVYALARRALDAQVLAQSPDDATGLITAPPLAIHALVSHAVSDADRDGLCLLLAEEDRLHVIQYGRSALEQIETLPWSPGVGLQASLEPWLASRSAPPRHVAWVRRTPPSTELIAEAEACLGCPHRRVDGLIDLPGLGEYSRYALPALVAVGGAIAALHPEGSFDLNASEADASASVGSGRVSWTQWAVAAGLLLLAAVALYAADLRRADGVQAQVAEAGLTNRGLAEVNLDLAVARHLETSGPHVLAILDEFSQKTQGFLIDELRFERDGQFTFRATARSSEEISQLAADLSTMRTLTGIRVRNQATKGRDEIEYTVVAQPNDRFFETFVSPPRPASPDDSANDGSEPTRP